MISSERAWLHLFVGHVALQHRQHLQARLAARDSALEAVRTQLTKLEQEARDRTSAVEKVSKLMANRALSSAPS